MKVFIIGLIAVNFLVFIAMYQRGYSFTESVYKCLIMEFWIVLVWHIIFTLCDVGIATINIIKKSLKKYHVYSSANAIIAMILMTAFQCIHIKGHSIIIGRTEAFDWE